MNMHLSVMMLLNVLELGAISTIFCMKAPKRRGWVWKASLCFAAMALYVFCFPMERLSYFAVHLPIVVTAFAYILLCYDISLREAVFLGLAAYNVQHISSLINSIVTFFFPEVFNHFAIENSVIGWEAYVLIVGVDVLTFFAAYFFIVRRLSPDALRKNATVPVIVLSAVVIVMNQLWAVGVTVYGSEDVSSIYSLMQFVWNLIACILALTVQFNIFSISKKDSEIEITKGMIAEKERQYKLSKSNIDAINRKCHDLKYQLSALKNGAASDKQIDEALEVVESFDSEIHTGNDALDIIFTEKNQYCKKHDINFVCMIDGEKLNFMDVTDQYVMFGNIIDNAINAVRQIKDHASRTIYVNIRAEKKLLLIQTENPFVGELEFRDGLPRTTTGDEFNHGFGVQSIRLIAEKYKGSVNTRAEDGIFYLNAVIPIGEKGEKE